jgi:small subunit ribosomal protein S9
MPTEHKKEVKEPKKVGRYHEGVGRRKTAVARVRLFAGAGAPTVNGKSLDAYFQFPRLAEIALAPLTTLQLAGKYHVSVKVAGGGIHAQADAVAHGIARVLVAIDPEYTKQLGSLGFLKRDPRMVERKKYGLKKARKAPQWAKR